MSTSIQFEHGTNGKIEFDHSGMGLLNLLAIGALESTAQESCQKNDFKKQYATNKNGLVKSVDHAEQVIEQLNCCITSVSNMAANANLEDVPESLQDIFYLIGELSKLSGAVSAIKSDMQYSLEQQA